MLACPSLYPNVLCAFHVAPVQEEETDSSEPQALSSDIYGPQENYGLDWGWGLHVKLDEE